MRSYSLDILGPPVLSLVSNTGSGSIQQKAQVKATNNASLKGAWLNGGGTITVTPDGTGGFTFETQTASLVSGIYRITAENRAGVTTLDVNVSVRRLSAPVLTLVSNTGVQSMLQELTLTATEEGVITAAFVSGGAGITHQVIASGKFRFITNGGNRTGTVRITATNAVGSSYRDVAIDVREVTGSGIIATNTGTGTKTQRVVLNSNVIVEDAGFVTGGDEVVVTRVNATTWDFTVPLNSGTGAFRFVGTLNGRALAENVQINVLGIQKPSAIILGDTGQGPYSRQRVNLSVTSEIDYQVSHGWSVGGSDVDVSVLSNNTFAFTKRLNYGSGRYFWTLTNEAGSTTVTLTINVVGLFPPRITVTADESISDLSKRVTLSLTSPPVTVVAEWLSNPNNIRLGQPSGTVFTFDGSVPTDTGTLRFTATNEAGSTTLDFLVQFVRIYDINSSATAGNLRSIAERLGYNGTPGLIRINVNAPMYSRTVTGTWPAGTKLEINLNQICYGVGGAGADYNWDNRPKNGLPGGDAFDISSAISGGSIRIALNSGGGLYAGGGGGGSGEWSSYGSDTPLDTYGGRGGQGAGNGSGPTASPDQRNYNPGASGGNYGQAGGRAAGNGGAPGRAITGSANATLVNFVQGSNVRGAIA